MPRPRQQEQSRHSSLWEQAEKAYAESRYAEAARLYSRLTRALPAWTAEWYTCQLHRAHCLRLAGAFHQALRLYRQLGQDNRSRANFSTTDALVGQALALRALGHLSTALAFLQQALQSYRKRRDTEGIIHTLWALGTTLRFAGDFRSAQHYLQYALQLCKKDHTDALTYLYCALGGLSRMQGAFKRSLTYYLRAHTYAMRNEDPFGIAYSACGIANAYRMFQAWELAEHYFSIARLHYEQIGDRLSYAYTLWGEAMSSLLQSRWDSAEERLQAAEALFRQTGDRRGRVYLTLARLQLLALHGQAPPAEIHALLRQALRQSQRHGYRFEALHLRLLEHLMGVAPIQPLSTLWHGYRQCGSLWFRRVLTCSLPVNFP